MARIPSPRPLLAAAVLSAAVFAGCGDNGSSPGRVSPAPADMAMVASDLALVTGLELQQVTVAGLISPAARDPVSGRAPAAVDTLLRDLVTCPLLLHHGDAVPSYYEFRFGAGCVSGFDGRSTSGSIRFTVDTDPPFGPFDIFSEFDAFVRDGRRVAGSVEVRGALLVPLTLEASGLAVSGQRANAFLSAELDVAPAADPCDGGAPRCGGWRVTEGVGLATTSLYVYNISVQDTLSLSGCFPHFVRGVIAVTSAGTYPAFIDFGDGTCDDVATMTVEGRTETLILGYGS